MDTEARLQHAQDFQIVQYTIVATAALVSYEYFLLLEQEVGLDVSIRLVH
ncbi:hypothetical protein SCHPADRAFT_948338 [Schizopora paradoxa]|uniref:Uncharacterized protein n=1 Tax=Schizopora paradoxa TaxID=27342 RepID=A0A0H2QW24_9AGAM|nr:hypothetical protein SCHPADRAFT_948338 [Schizopora paradoxa]